MAVHRGEVEAAQAHIMQMEQTRNRLDTILGIHQDLYTGSVKVALQEYAEAHVLLSVVTKGSYPDPRELSIPAILYILGLADTYQA